MCDIPNDIAMDGNLGEPPAVDTREAEKVDALQLKLFHGGSCTGHQGCWGQQANQTLSRMGNKSRVTRKMGSIKESRSVQAIANCVELRWTKVNRKELKIDRTMEFGQSRLIDWDHVAEVKQDIVANPPDSRLQLLVRDDKGMGMPLPNSIHVTGYFACPM